MVHAAVMSGRARVARGLAGGTAAALLAVAIAMPVARTGTVPLALAATIIIAAALAPRPTLLCLAAVFPLTAVVLPVLLHVPASTADVVFPAFLSGACAHHAMRPCRGAVPRPYLIAAITLLSIVAVSFAVQVTLAAVLATPAGLPAYMGGVWRAFLHRPAAMPSAVAAAQTGTAIVVSTIAAAYASEPDFRDRMIVASAAGAAGSALLSVQRVLEIALRTGHPLIALPHVLHTVRASGAISDPNAAGSYFVLLLVPAAASAIDARGVRRWAWALLSSILALGLWTSGSRAAVLVGIAVTIGVAIVQGVRKPRWRVPMAGALLAGAVLVAVLFPNPIFDRSLTSAAGIRVEMTRAAMRMWKTNPVLGVGIGRFYDRSADFIRDPYVRDLYGRENAHDNFLQILAELGFVGLAAFVLVLWTAAPPLRQADGLSLGLGAFLVTCLAGHPLLIPQVAIPFWILLGTAASRNRASSAHSSVRWVAYALAAVAVCAAIPSYRTERAVMSLEHAGSGVSAWHVGPEGVHFREMHGSGRVFAPTYAPQFSVPLRAGDSADVPITLEISIDGRPADRMLLSRDWQTERLQIPAGTRVAFVAIDLLAVDAHGRPGVVQVGKVEPLGR